MELNKLVTEANSLQVRVVRAGDSHDDGGDGGSSSRK